MSNLQRPSLWLLISGLSIFFVSTSLGIKPASALNSNSPSPEFHVKQAKQNSSDAPYIRMAHVGILKRLPSKNDVVGENISVVEIWFTSAVDREKSSIAVIGPGKKRADNRQVTHSVLDPGHISVGVKDLRDGLYKVRYRALAADGHTVSGSYVFTVKRGSNNSAQF